MVKRYPEEPDYSCPDIDAVLEALDDIETNWSETEVSFSNLRNTLERIRETNDTLRSDAREFYEAGDNARNILESLR